jgi:hypothetical protein
VEDDELESLIGALDANLNAVYRLDPLWKQRGEWKNGERGSVLCPPATKKEIESLGTRLGKAIPTSYARFLRLHDGWKHFWMDFAMIGTKGEHTEAALPDIRRFEAWQRAALEKRLGTISASAIKDWESTHPKNLYLQNHFVFATDGGGSVLVFDGRQKSAASHVIRHWSIANGASNDEFYEESYLGAPAVKDVEHLLVGVNNEVVKYLGRLKRSKAKRKRS